MRKWILVAGLLGLAGTAIAKGKSKTTPIKQVLAQYPNDLSQSGSKLTGSSKVTFTKVSESLLEISGPNGADVTVKCGCIDNTPNVACGVLGEEGSSSVECVGHECCNWK